MADRDLGAEHDPVVLFLELRELVDMLSSVHQLNQEEAGPAPAARRIGNGFPPPPPVFLHEPGRFEGTQADTSRLDGCRQTLEVDRVRPQTTRRPLVTETRSNGFDSSRPSGLAPAHGQRLCPTSRRGAPTAGGLITCGDRPRSRSAASCSACDGSSASEGTRGGRSPCSRGSPPRTPLPLGSSPRVRV